MEQRIWNCSGPGDGRLSNERSTVTRPGGAPYPNHPPVMTPQHSQREELQTGKDIILFKSHVSTNYGFEVSRCCSCNMFQDTGRERSTGFTRRSLHKGKLVGRSPLWSSKKLPVSESKPLRLVGVLYP